MKKLKIIISDFHLGNGRYLPDGTVNSLEDFNSDEKFVEFMEHYGEQPPDTHVELIVNGDFFNMIQLLPEEKPDDILSERAAVSKIEAIIQGHKSIFSSLKAFNEKPRRRVVFLLGNHDPGLLWKEAQEIVRRSVQGDVLFVDEAYRFDGVHVEHGHQLEPIHRFNKERYFLTRGYPEPLLNLPWGVFFVKDFLYRIKRRRPYVDKVKPFGQYLRWCLYNDFWFGLLTILRYTWFVCKTRLSKMPLKRAGAFAGLKAVWELTRTPTLEDAAREILQKGDCRIVVLGHSHIPVHRNFGQDREYFNPGCWNNVTSLDIPSLGHSLRLMYVLVEYQQGKPFARMMEWHGQQRIFEDVIV
jgi:UDP-2,3-diacylglucosamine pyrophosphatase LpxH